MFLLIWLILIFIFSVMPRSLPQTDLPVPEDKIAHFILYGLTSIFFFRYLVMKTAKNRALFLSVFAASAYGATMELLQYFIPHRAFSLGDVAANTSGAFIFCILYTKRRK